MATSPWLENLTNTPEGMAHFQQERVILDVTERICELMKETGISRSELAVRLNTSKAHVSQLLSGRRNMTLRTLADLYCALGRSIQFADAPLYKAERLVGEAEAKTSVSEGKAFKTYSSNKPAVLQMRDDSIDQGYTEGDTSSSNSIRRLVS